MSDHRHGPSWGSEGPPWRGGERWGGGPGRSFRRGAAVFLVVLVVLVAALATIVAGVVAGDAPPPVITAIVAAVVMVGLLVSARALWRSTRTVGTLMDAADRVAGGDYAARVGPAPSRQLRRLTVAFDDMAERLETNERRRRELLGDIAHELRTPLQVMRGSIEGMLDGLYDTDPVRLRALLDETLLMSRLLDDLRTLSMAEEGVLALHVEPVDPRALAVDAVRSFDTIAAEAGVSVSVDEGSVPTVEADPVRVAEVLHNLLANAIRHTPPDGRVEVRVRDEPDLVRFEVDDTGTGIAPEDLPRVFDRFVRSADTGGSGLGLAIAKRLVLAHGGTIEAERRPEGGTRISFTIPR